MKVVNSKVVATVMFDIRPVDKTGRVDVAKIYRIQPVVNLASLKPAKKEDEKLKVAIASPQISPQQELEIYLNSKLNIKKELKAVGVKVEKGGSGVKPRYRQIFVRQKSELTTSQVGATCEVPTFQDDYQPILSEINRKVGLAMEVALVSEPRRIDPFELTTSQVVPTCEVPASAEIESWVRYARAQSASNFQFFPIAKLSRILDKVGTIFPPKADPQPEAGTAPLADNFQSIFKSQITKTTQFVKSVSARFANKRNFLVVGTVGFSALIFSSFGQYGISVKNEVLKESNSAVANLEKANESLRAFDFEAASNNFTQAYAEFSKAGENLNFMGASLTSLFAELPGAEKLKSAKNLVEAGKLLAESGKSMSEAVNSLSKTGAMLKLTNNQQPTTASAGSRKGGTTNNLFGDLKKSLASSSKNLSKAGALLSDVSVDALPEDKREAFLEFQSKLPELEGIVSDAVEYASFMERFLGTGTVKYLVLFQNDSELRPTGGFPGTYAVVTFKDGRLDGFLVDDVYNLDGQLKENIIPPKPLQHITPNWGMRDANWFIDFSASAQKAMEFYEMITSRTCNTSPTCKGIDGVITISPRMISDILKVVGPIEMPEYDFTINDENFLSTIQAEVEYGDNREQPKQVLKDMAPKLLEKIYSSSSDKWLDIFNVFISGLDKKDILMYFKDLNLQSFVVDNEFSGSVKNTDGDYLMVTFTNVKGSKTDKVTDTFIKLETQFNKSENHKPQTTNHKLTITRLHNGGDTEYGFYNKQNPAYVRVLVPEDSELVSISGNSNPGFKPLISYSGADLPAQAGFKQDDDLFKLESSFEFDGEKGVGTYKESGKTGFAFWLITDPGKRKTVELEYIVPLPTLPVVETQETGTRGQGVAPSRGGQATAGNIGIGTIYIQKQPGLEVDNFEFQVGDTLLYNGDFDKDLELRFKAE